MASATTFDGTLAGSDGSTGTITVTVQTAVASSSRFSIIRRAEAGLIAPATGECVFAGQAPVSLSGTYTPSTGALNLTGDGTTFTGTANGQGMSGTFSNPSTGLSGGFSGSSTSNGNTVQTFCGTYQKDPVACPTGDSGVFNINLDSNGGFSGTAQPTSGGGSPGQLSGQLGSDGTSFSGTSSPDGNALSGTISGNNVSGTFVQACDPNVGTGTFSGSTSACQ